MANNCDSAAEEVTHSLSTLAMAPLLQQHTECCLLQRGNFEAFASAHAHSANNSVNDAHVAAAVSSASLACVTRFLETFKTVHHTAGHASPASSAVLLEATTCKFGVNRVKQEEEWARRIQIIDVALAFGADIDCLQSLPVINAAKMGDVAVFTHLVRNGANPLAIHNEPFIQAVKHRHLRLTRLLIMHFKVKVDTRHGSAMLTACSQGNIPMIRLLLEHGAALDGYDVLQAAIAGGCTATVSFLINEQKLAWYAVNVVPDLCKISEDDKQVEMTRLFRDAVLSNSAALKTFDYHALHSATGAAAAIPILQYLVHQCDVLLDDYVPGELLATAAKHARHAVIDFLVANGVSLARHGERALYKCVEWGALSTIGYLIVRGADLSAHVRSTMKMLAIVNQMPRISQYLDSTESGVEAEKPSL